MAKPRKKVSNPKQPPKHEMIPYVDYLTDTRKIKAAQILAFSGYTRGKHQQGAISTAAKEANVNRMTIYHWLENDPDFLTAVEETKHELCAVAVKSLQKMAIKGNPAVCMFLAQQLAPDIYSQQHKRHEQEKELLHLRAKLGLPDADLTPPSITIVAQTIESKDYERNKLE